MDAKQTKEIYVTPGRFVISLAGAIFIGLGLANQFDIDVIPLEWRFEGYGIIFILVGAALFALSAIQFVRRIKDIQQRRRI